MLQMTQLVAQANGLALPEQEIEFMQQDNKNFVQNFVLFSLVLSVFIAGVIYDTFYIQDQKQETPSSMTTIPSTRPPTMTPTTDLPNTALPTETENFETLELRTSDGLVLYGRYYPPSDPQNEPGAILLLHGAYQDTRRWFGLIEAASQRNFGVLSIDLRGHGKSEGQQEFDAAMDQDVEAALAWLEWSGGYQMDQVVVVGESLGGSLGLRAGTQHSDIAAAVILSPGLQLWDIGISEAFDQYGERPLLLITAEQDGYPMNTVQALQDRAGGSLTVEQIPGAAHGTDLFQAHPDLLFYTLDWIQSALEGSLP
jgi:pimeloyl-ACP methyl ester carboxylesterase